MTQQIKSLFDRYHNQREQHGPLAEETLQKIKTLNLDANPIHFTLFFEWLSQNDPYLSDEIEQAIKQNSYNDVIAESLYISFIGQLLYDATPTEQMGQMLQKLEGHLKEYVQTGNKQHNRLQQAIKSLPMDELSDSTQSLIQKDIIGNVQTLLEQGDQLKQQVRDANQEIQFLKKELQRHASISKTDELTNLTNRNGFNDLLTQSIASANEQQSCFALILIDLDNFTQLNEEFGYLIGDSVLRYVAKLINNELKEQGQASRFEGQQFSIIIPGCTFDDAIKMAETIRRKLSERPLQAKSNHKKLQLSLSAGVSLYQLGEDSMNLLERTMQHLQSAKSLGKNRIHCNED